MRKDNDKNSQVKLSPPLEDNILAAATAAFPSTADIVAAAADNLEMLFSIARCWRYSIATRATPPRVIEADLVGVLLVLLLLLIYTCSNDGKY